MNSIFTGLERRSSGPRHCAVLLAALAVIGCSTFQRGAAELNPGKERTSHSLTPPTQATVASQAVVYPPEDVTDPGDLKKTMTEFDRHLKPFGQSVRSCHQVIRMQIGKNSLVYGRGLAAYGAFCDLANGELVAMCYEEAIGRFVIVSGHFVTNRSWVTAFTSRSCARLS